MNVNYKTEEPESIGPKINNRSKGLRIQKKVLPRHVKKWVNMRSGIGSLKDWTIRYKLIKAPGQ